MATIKALFWVSAALVAYTYAGYPLLAAALARAIGKPVRRAPILPRVTVLTAARNEAEHIRETVVNKLTQDYPPELLDVIVVSDESDDGTDEIVESLGDRVRLIRQQPRAGKTEALNRAAPQASGDVLVFSDANSIYAEDTVRNLVANFADDSVGYVTGKMVYVTVDGSLVGDGCSGYMRYENWLRVRETQLASVIGVDGGVDAVRKSLFRPMRADQLPDFVLPLLVAAGGFRVVYEPGALLKEQALSSHYDEYRMRVRVSLRALWALWDLRRLLNPLKYGLLSLQIASHKVLRYLAFVPLMSLLATSVVLAGQGGVYLLAALCQVVVYSLAAVGWRRQSGSALLSVPYYFVLVNVAAAHAAIRFVKGEKQATWTPRTG